MFRFVFSFVLCLICLTAFGQPMGRDYWIDRYLSVCYPLKHIKVNSSFGSRKDPFTGEKTFHSGLDLQADYEEVYSMFNGQVKKIGSDNRSGRYVTLQHGEYTVSFCHLSKVTCKEGEQLIAGDQVGISGNSGRSTGPHLHITCKYKGDTKDPSILLTYIKDVRAEAMAALGNGKSEKNLSRVNEKDFLERYSRAAMEQQQRYGIPASVTLAQMAWESGWGCSTLATSGNNFFGIKCSKAWLEAGKPYSIHDDDRRGEKFCNYASVEESVEHHSKLLMGRRYRRCHRYEPTDYHNWLMAIKAAGYATNPDYVRKLESIIKRHKLYLYDRQALQT